MLKLIQNEWMKLWSKKGTWVMAALLVILVFVIAGGVKYSHKFMDLPNWKTIATNQKADLTIQLQNKNLSTERRNELEGELQVVDYRLQHNVAPLLQSSREQFILDSNGMISIVTLLTVIVAAGIVASEFSQGTIKMLLSRPVRRWKVLASKYSTVLLFSVSMSLLSFLLAVICAFIFFPSEGGQLLKWNGEEVVTVSLWLKSLYMLLLSFVNVWMIATFAFMIGAVFRSGALAIGLALFINFTGPTVTFFLAKYEIAKYVLFTHDLTQYETGYKMIEDLSMPFSLAVLSVYLIVFLVVSFLTFTRRDVAA